MKSAHLHQAYMITTTGHWHTDKLTHWQLGTDRDRHGDDDRGQGQGKAPPEQPGTPHCWRQPPARPLPLSPSPGQLRCPVQCMLANRCDGRDAVTYKRTAGPLLTRTFGTSLPPVVA